MEPFSATSDVSASPSLGEPSSIPSHVSTSPGTDALSHSSHGQIGQAEPAIVFPGGVGSSVPSAPLAGMRLQHGTMSYLRRSPRFNPGRGPSAHPLPPRPVAPERPSPAGVRIALSPNAPVVPHFPYSQSQTEQLQQLLTMMALQNSRIDAMQAQTQAAVRSAVEHEREASAQALAHAINATENRMRADHYARDQEHRDQTEHLQAALQAARTAARPARFPEHGGVWVAGADEHVDDDGEVADARSVGSSPSHRPEGSQHGSHASSQHHCGVDSRGNPRSRWFVAEMAPPPDFSTHAKAVTKEERDRIKDIEKTRKASRSVVVAYKSVAEFHPFRIDFIEVCMAQGIWGGVDHTYGHLGDHPAVAYAARQTAFSLLCDALVRGGRHDFIRADWKYTYDVEALWNAICLEYSLASKTGAVSRARAAMKAVVQGPERNTLQDYNSAFMKAITHLRQVQRQEGRTSETDADLLDEYRAGLNPPHVTLLPHLYQVTELTLFNHGHAPYPEFHCQLLRGVHGRTSTPSRSNSTRPCSPG